MDSRKRIHPDIHQSHTLPGTFYHSKDQYLNVREKVFSKSWQLITHESQIEPERHLYPFEFFPGSINEPLLLSSESISKRHVLSNVCTHRGNILVTSACRAGEIRCGYHGRRFHQDGKFKFMPETKGMVNFPNTTDDLPQLPLFSWKSFFFTCLNEPFALFSEWMAEMDQRMGWLPLDQFIYSPERFQSYDIQANWALYCDNYLEGFHIPFVHPELNQNLIYNQYKTVPGKWSVLQIGVAKEGELCFDLPKSSPDFGQNIAAYYFWLFPNIMFNFYPWGLSVNQVFPQSVNTTKVEFNTYIWKPELLDKGAGADLNTVELQDEHIVEQVQRGVTSLLYKKGRFAPNVEQGVHRFHSIMDNLLNPDL